MIFNVSGYTPALACCQTQEAASCLQLILEALLPGVSGAGTESELGHPSEDPGSDIEEEESISRGVVRVEYSDTENSIDSETF